MESVLWPKVSRLPGRIRYVSNKYFVFLLRLKHSHNVDLISAHLRQHSLHLKES